MRLHPLTAMNFLQNLRLSLTDFFNLKPSLVSQEEAEAGIREGVSFRGTNILILIMAIFIASPERFGRDEAADEASGTYNQYFLHISCENSWMYWSVIFSVPKRSSTERCSSSRGMSALRAHMIPSAMSAESL